MVRAVSAAETAPTTYAWAIHAEALRVRAGRRMAVDGLDLSMGNGVHGLLGPNGAGKTTLVRAIATVLRPAGGTLTVLGEKVNGRIDLRGLRRQIGYLPQEFGYYRRFTVREFVEYIA
jgi:ABC-2 type transport system ATP-binding protein